MVLFAIASSGSPGPNNMLLTTTGANYGFARSLPHVFGTGVGICIIFLGLGVFGSQLLENETFRNVLKWGGVVYLAWLALKIATSRPDAASQGDADSAQPLTFIQALFFQALNPKVWLGGASGILLRHSLRLGINPGPPYRHLEGAGAKFPLASCVGVGLSFPRSSSASTAQENGQ
ncbi:LysE family translocator [Rhizobium sp. LjRoot258]|uniref:LysE family translocator n=1 Tax=Rhizobium sp. LjRoot258 TaxID=3342299 RepID=UPI003ECFBAF0